MHAWIKKTWMKNYDTMVEGHVYSISNFGLNSYTGTYRYSRHPQKLVFFMYTKVAEVENNGQVPYNSFNFVDFDLIISKSVDDIYLVGKFMFYYKILLNVNSV